MQASIKKVAGLMDDHLHGIHLRRLESARFYAPLLHKHVQRLRQVHLRACFVPDIDTVRIVLEACGSLDILSIDLSSRIIFSRFYRPLVGVLE